MAGIKDIKFLTRPVQKFQAGGTAGVLDFDAIPEIMDNIKRPNLMGDPTKIGLESLGPLFAMAAAGAYPAVSALTEAEARDRGIIQPPDELTEEEKKRLGLYGGMIGGGFSQLSDDDKLPTTTAGEIPKVDTTTPPTTTKPEEKAEPIGGGFTQLEDKDKLPTIITMAKDKADLKTGKEYYDDLGGFDDVVTRNVLVNKNRRLYDIAVGNKETDRKDRTAIRYQVSQNKDVKDFVNLVQNKEGRFYDEKVFSRFSDLYKQQNPMLVEYLRSVLGTSVFNNIRQQSEKIPVEEGGITQEDKDFYASVRNQTSPQQKNMDVIFQRAEKVLRNYKANNPTATGYEIKGNKVGDINIEDILFQDSKLKEYLIEAQPSAFKSETQKDRSVTERGSRTSKKSLIINTLREDGLFKELGLDKFFIMGAKIKPINDPRIDKYLADNKIDKLPKDFDYSSLLDQNEKLLLTEAQSQVGQLTSGTGVNKQVADMVRSNVNRMLLYGLRDGKTMAEVMESFKKQTADDSFLKEVVPLMIETVKTKNYITGLNKDLGLDLDNVVLSHSQGVIKNIDLTFKINNLFTGSEKLNQEESTIQRAIQKQKDILNEKNVSDKEILEANKEIKNLEASLESKGYYESVESPSPATTSPDVQKQIKEKISEAMFGDPRYYKDGGIVGISHLTRPL
jgi:urease gamma subunit